VFLIADMQAKGCFTPEQIERARKALEETDRLLGTEPAWPFPDHPRPYEVDR
jgi:hypothetical protein